MHTQDSRVAMLAMLATMLASIVVALASTALYQLEWIGGLAWQLCLGVGLFVCYSVRAHLRERLDALGLVCGGSLLLSVLCDAYRYGCLPVHMHMLTPCTCL